MYQTMSVREGVIIIEKNQVQVIWDDAPYCPEPFPLIFDRDSRDSKKGKILKNAKSEFTIYVDIESRNIMCPLMNKVTIIKTNKNIQKKLLFDSDEKDIPMEEAKLDSNILSLNLEKKQELRNVKVKWDDINSVLRMEDTKEIVGVPDWQLWKKLIQKKQFGDQKLKADLHWNPLVEKYQVITIKKNGR